MDFFPPTDWPEVTQQQFYDMIEQGRSYQRKGWVGAVEYLDIVTQTPFAYELDGWDGPSTSAKLKKYIIHPDLAPPPK
jgi:hypothetical protein